MGFFEDIGLAIGVYKVFSCIDSSTDLKREQLTNVQLQNENLRLKNQIAQTAAHAAKFPYYTLNDVTEDHRKMYPDLTDADWQKQCTAHNIANGWAY
jgi:hypothetical protein